MVAKKFAVGDSIYVRAQQAWLILVAFVMMQQDDYKKMRAPLTLSYGDLARLMGYSDARAAIGFGRLLGLIGEFCVENGLPPLNAIVVNEQTRQPGDHVLLRKTSRGAYHTVEHEQTAVWRENWFLVRIPTAGAFRELASEAA